VIGQADDGEPFGGEAALGLACLGLYGTISYAVRRRTTEIGMRMALGADRSAKKWLVVREALLLVVVGGAVGVPLAFVAARAVGGLLYGTAPRDPVLYGTAVGVLIVVAAFAAYMPARTPISLFAENNRWFV
jgi:ABC-type antimicrobial peptide transport system permease subunit